ncbi:hypothetical protein PVAND_012049 [Polypedilum vanderplanki]|uniref:Uncharacterized protein n=1 Tax=Polypedilum vanderplanki TaxID=319348 RepID=A0A9J6CM52_POLVA|nr:hypothetical protein PVAND_012049 [Polypedilum vanderplanki]
MSRIVSSSTFLTSNKNINNGLNREDSSVMMKHFSHHCTDKFAKYANSATFVGKKLFNNDSGFDANLNVDRFNYHHKPALAFSVRRQKRTSPEEEKKQKIAFEAWRTNVDARKKIQKHIEKERAEALEKKKNEEVEKKKLLNDMLVCEWFARKKQEAKSKTAKHDETRKSCEQKKKQAEKVFKHALSHEEWLYKKKEELKAQKSVIDKRIEAKKCDPRLSKIFKL